MQVIMQPIGADGNDSDVYQTIVTLVDGVPGCAHGRR